MNANVRFFRVGCPPIYEREPHTNGGKFLFFFSVDFHKISYVIPPDLIKNFLNLIVHMLCGQLGYENDIVCSFFPHYTILYIQYIFKISILLARIVLIIIYYILYVICCMLYVVCCMCMYMYTFM
jgi:hypothetical protein